LTTDKVAALLGRIQELQTAGKPVTYELLASTIGEEELADETA
jgi:hypothetical protein